MKAKLRRSTKNIELRRKKQEEKKSRIGRWRGEGGAGRDGGKEEEEVKEEEVEVKEEEEVKEISGERGEDAVDVPPWVGIACI